MKNLSIGDVSIATVVESQRVSMSFAEFLPEAAAAREVLEAARPWLEPRFADVAAGVGFLDFHSYLVRTPRHVILIDTCIGDDKERGGHKFFHRLKTPWLANLRAAGVAPEQVDQIGDRDTENRTRQAILEAGDQGRDVTPEGDAVHADR
jgi:hypothetical protein